MDKLDVESEVEHIRDQSKALLQQELNFASHLGVPAILINLHKPTNTQLARIINEKLVGPVNYSVWINIPMVHPSQYSPLAEEKHDSWQWWNNFRTYCSYDKRVGVVLEMPDIEHLPTPEEVNRWIGEPVRALIIPTSLFLMNQYHKPVLSKSHQELIKKFMTIDVQYIIKADTEVDLGSFQGYMNFLGKKLFTCSLNSDFIQG